MRKLLLIAILTLPLLTGSAQSSRSVTREVQKMSQFLNYLGAGYIDTINMQQTVEGAIVDMLSKLDPHSVYVTREEMEGIKEDFAANFDGIGIEFRVYRDTLMVVNTITGGPSEKVGLQPNDRIVKVDGNSIIGVKEADVQKLLKGPKGTSVNVSVNRQGVREELQFTIIRDKIPIYTVDAAYKIEDRAGYVKVNRFAATTNSELQDAISKMGALDILILDLRGNGGGFLDQAVSVSNNFLQRGSLVVSMEGRSIPVERMFARSNPIFPNGKLIVLVDEFSASASEIVAGAVQDWDRGLIIGRRTFGKGLVQSQYPLLDGSAVRITVARYHTPSGRVIQSPYSDGGKEEYYTNFVNRFNDDSDYAMVDSTEFKTLIAGRTIYGGGGITPDIIVPRDTAFYSDYWSKLVRSGTIIEYMTDYIDRNRGSLSARYADFDSFEKGFVVDDGMISGLVKLGEDKSVPYDEVGMAKSRLHLTIQLKALVAQRLWGVTEYYRIINSGTDEIYARALDVLNDWPSYSKQLSAPD